MIKNLNLEKANIKYAYSQCLKRAKEHYENFPVASIFLPKKMQYPIAAIYAFAREADDYSDEGNFLTSERLKNLSTCWHKLELIQSGNNNYFKDDYIYQALQHTIYSFNLPIQLFFDLLTAFKQDVTKKTYNNFAEVLAYCEKSANPIGRLLLCLAEQQQEKHELFILSDKICTALQLINFLQDIYEDFVKRKRCYLPQDEMSAYGFTLTDIHNNRTTKLHEIFIKEQIKKAHNLLNEGKELGYKLQGVFGLEIRLIISGGETIINNLYNRKNVYERPTLKTTDWLKILLTALQKSKYTQNN